MYLNLIQLAESFGVSEKTVESWIRNDGLPHIPKRGALLFDREQVARWAMARGKAGRAGFLAREKPALKGGLRLLPLLERGGVWRGVAPGEVRDLFARVTEAMPGTTPEIRAMLDDRLRAADGVNMAPVGRGFAIPHPSNRIALGADSGTLALALLASPLPPHEMRIDDVPVTRLLFFVAPSPRDHLQMVARLSKLISKTTLRRELDEGADDERVRRIVAAADDAVIAGELKGGRG